MKYVAFLLVTSLIPLLDVNTALNHEEPPTATTRLLLEEEGKPVVNIDDSVSKGETSSCEPGIWIVTMYNPNHWICDRGGGCCCPEIDCERQIE